MNTPEIITENPSTEPLATTACRICGTSITYEPIIVGATDLALALYTTCERCQEVAEVDYRRKETEREQSERHARVLATIPPALLPLAYDVAGTDIYNATFRFKSWQAIRQWRPGPHGDWIGLIGPAGMCKTRILALLAAKIIEDGKRLIWTTATRIHAEAGNLRMRDYRTAAPAREYLRDCMLAPFLVIDDIGKNEWSPSFETEFFQILDHRKNYRLPVLYSSNAHPTEFSVCLSSLNAGPIIGRLLERTSIFTFTS